MILVRKFIAMLSILSHTLKFHPPNYDTACSSIIFGILNVRRVNYTFPQNYLTLPITKLNVNSRNYLQVGRSLWLFKVFCLTFRYFHFLYFEYVDLYYQLSILCVPQI